MYDFVTRTVLANEAGLKDTLDEIHALCVANMRPWWACANPPYPARKELDKMMVQTTPPLTLVIALYNGEIVGFDFHSPEGVLVAGFIKHHDSHKGYTNKYDQWALDLQAAMNEQVKRNTGGTIYHVTYKNQAIWYALEVLMGIPRAPKPYPQSDEQAPIDWPAYNGPPVPKG